MPLLAGLITWGTLAAMALLFGPDVIEQFKEGGKGIGRSWGRALGLEEGPEDIKETKKEEQTKFLGMLEEKVRESDAEREPEADPEMLGLMTMLNQMAPGQDLGGAEALQTGGQDLFGILGVYGAGSVDAGRVQRAATPMPMDPRLLPLAMLRGGR